MLDAIEKKANQRTPESLSTKVVRGGLWVFALRIINRGLGFVRTIILARLLAPEDFGLLGIAAIAISTLETFSQTGFEAALIQKKENVESYLDTVWTVSTIRGTFLFCILFFSAPLVATFFNSLEASLVIKVVAISTLLSGFKNIGVVFFQKELEFDRQFYYEFSATLVHVTVSITLAFLLRNVWALVWGGLAASLTRLIVSYLIHPYRPRMKLEKEKFQDLLGFGRWVAGSSILIFLITQGDDIFVGKILGLTALGLYQMAYLISNLPATEITHVISQIAFPTYSKLQDDLNKLTEVYLRVLQITAFVSIPLAGGILILAPEFTKIFFGHKWMPMVPALQALVIWGLIRAIGATTGPIFQGIGKPHVATKLQFLQLLLLLISMYPLTARFGILGTSLAVVFAGLAANLVGDYVVIKLTGCGIKNFAKTITSPLLNTVLVALIIYLLKTYWLIPVQIIHLLFLLILGTLLYLLITFFFARSIIDDLYNIVRQ